MADLRAEAEAAWTKEPDSRATASIGRHSFIAGFEAGFIACARPRAARIAEAQEILADFLSIDVRGLYVWGVGCGRIRHYPDWLIELLADRPAYDDPKTTPRLAGNLGL